MTTTPPTWSELHAMVPECRPKVPPNRTDSARMLVAPATGKIVASVASIDSWWSIPDEWTDALCGFAAVEWLAKWERNTDVRVFFRGGEWCVDVYALMAGGEPDSCQVSEIGPTLDAALRAAVAAVAGDGK